ncbi:MAG TPA: ribosome silencing factor [Gammaproteobacteria bacterium]|nr:ribosome silencing factor [Gammaproteobacteria bacterium]
MTESDMRLEQLEQVVRHALDELKAVEPVMLDVRGKTPLTDMMFVVSGNSSRHVKSIADNVVDKAKEAGLRPVGIEGEDAGEWILVDLGDAVVHVMLPAVRELYRLEGIWGFEADEDLSLLNGTQQ